MRRRHLRDVSHQDVGLRVGLLDLGPPLGESELARLVEQVGVLAARDLVHVDVGRSGELARLERRVEGAHLGVVEWGLELELEFSIGMPVRFRVRFRLLGLMLALTFSQ